MVNTLTGRGSPSALLTELSADAELIVVGSRGHGTLRGMVAGSVSGHVVSRARCPVIVMRGDPGERGAREVLVGFDGSPASRAALRFAAAEAYRLGSPVHVVIARNGGEADTLELRIQAQGLAWDELRAHPDLQASVELADEPARRALLEAARKACLLVVGARGLGEVRGLLLGSVSQAMIHHAPCPVAVSTDQTRVVRISAVLTAALALVIHRRQDRRPAHHREGPKVLAPQILMWAAELPLANNPFMDDHIVYAIVLIGLALTGAGTTLGLGNLPIVQRTPWLK